MFRFFAKDAPEITFPNGYRIYTTKFDREITATFPDVSQLHLEKRIKAFDQYLDEFETGFDVHALKFVDKMRATVNPQVLEDTVVTILVDHSGSMRGQRALFAMLIITVMSQALSRLGISQEILGFTTSSWHGGRSRRRWKRHGKIENPGRLCDLLHIVYQDAASSSLGAPFSIRMMLDNDVLKENIDGEALLWAASRLERCKQHRKVILQISDGAPVDHSTLSTNPVDLLHEHIQAVVRELSTRENYRIGGIGIDHNVELYFPESIALKSTDAIASELLPFLGRMLMQPQTTSEP